MMESPLHVGLWQLAGQSPSQGMKLLKHKSSTFQYEDAICLVCEALRKWCLRELATS